MLVLSGCAWVLPTPWTPHVSGHEPIDDEVELLEVGTTTRIDVLLLCGDPDAVLRDETVFAYEWKRAWAHWAVVGRDSGAEGTFKYRQMCVMLFDRRGVLQRFEKFTFDKQLSTREDAEKWLDEWIAGD